MVEFVELTASNKANLKTDDHVLIKPKEEGFEVSVVELNAESFWMFFSGKCESLSEAKERAKEIARERGFEIVYIQM